jgi:hypothetical protein
MNFDIILAAVVIIVAANYGIPAWNEWRERKAVEKRMREVIKHR